MITRLPYWRHALAVRERAHGIGRKAALMAVCLVMLAAWMTSANAQGSEEMPSAPPGATTQGAPVSAPNTAGAPERAAARRQIEQQRRNLDAAYARQQTTCQRQFFVNDCLQNASRRYRSAAGALDAQLNALDLAEREQRAAAERARVARNLRERQLPGAQAIQKRRTELEQEQASKRLQRRPRPHATPRPGAQAPPVNASGAEAAYAAKLADYQRRQRDAARRAQQKAPAPPLPLPPGY